MPSRLTALIAVLVLLSGCGEPETPASLTHDELDQLISSLDAPAVVVLWAEWSRPSVELLPAFAELAEEYEGQDVALVAACLSEAPSREAQRILRRFPANVRQVTLEGEPPFTLARYGLGDVPAALVYGPGGELLFNLEGSDREPLTPADLADAIESLIGPYSSASGGPG